MRNSAHISDDDFSEGYDAARFLRSDDAEADTYIEGMFASEMLVDPGAGVLADDGPFNIDMSSDSVERMLSGLNLSKADRDMIMSLSHTEREKAVNELVAKNSNRQGILKRTGHALSTLYTIAEKPVAETSNIVQEGDRVAATSDPDEDVKDLTTQSVSNAASSIAPHHGKASRKSHSAISTATASRFQNAFSQKKAAEQQSVLEQSQLSLKSDSSQNKATWRDSKQLTRSHNTQIGQRSARARTRKIVRNSTAAGASGVRAADRVAARVGRAFSNSFNGFGSSIVRGLAAFLIPVVIVCLIVVLFAGVGGMTVMAAAVTAEEEDAANDVGSLEGVPAEIAAYLKSLGWGNIPIAAVLGNIEKESSFDYTANHEGYEYDGQLLWDVGLFQYTSVGSRENGEYGSFMDWCAANDIDPLTVNAQMSWTFDETFGTGEGYWERRWNTRIGVSNNIYSYYQYTYGFPSRADETPDEFLAEDDLNVATFSWMACYEKPANGDAAHLAERQQAAYNYYLMLTSTSEYDEEYANEIVARAYAQLGKPYYWGATGPDSFDCSGLVGYCVTGVYGVRIGTTYTFYFNTDGHWPTVSDPQPGDIWVKDDGNGNGHTGIYIGNNQYINAPRTGDVVKISTVPSDGKFVRYTP